MSKKLNYTRENLIELLIKEYYGNNNEILTYSEMKNNPRIPAMTTLRTYFGETSIFRIWDIVLAEIIKREKENGNINDWKIYWK